MTTNKRFEGEGEVADAIRGLQRQLALASNGMSCFDTRGLELYTEALTRAVALLVPAEQLRQEMVRRLKRETMLSELLAEGMSKQEALDLILSKF